MKKLRYGRTTGTCATAAAMAALRWLLGRSSAMSVVRLPDGRFLPVPVSGIQATPEGAEAWVIKDGGDDPDVTHGLAIVVSARLDASGEIRLEAGPGVGIVTRPGLPVSPGEPAINPGPRKMILEAAKQILPAGLGATVRISIPGGAEVALRTYNPRLGIEGGLSVLGTRGIVVPMSEESLVETLHSELSVKRSEMRQAICLAPGNYGEAVAVSMGVPADGITKMSNFFGQAMEMVEELGFKEILVVGQVGKMLKVAGGSLHTHSKYSDGRLETLAALSASAGASRQQVLDILEKNTADEACREIHSFPWGQEALQNAAARIATVVRRKAPVLEKVGVVLFVLPGQVLTVAGPANPIVDRLKKERSL
jgi:cobalt-precorrin-5B (C1)-methyltransferase